MKVGGEKGMGAAAWREPNGEEMHQTEESMRVTEPTTGRAAARGQGGQRAKLGWQSREAMVAGQQRAGGRLCRKQDSSRWWEKHGGRSRLSYFAVPRD